MDVSRYEFACQKALHQGLQYARSLGHKLRFSAPARAVRKLPVPVRMALTAPARKVLRKPVPVPDLPADLMARLEDVLRPDAARLREMTGLELAHWSV